MAENIEEICQVRQDALDDAVLMGCDDKQVRAVLISLIEGLEAVYEP